MRVVIYETKVTCDFCDKRMHVSVYVAIFATKLIEYIAIFVTKMRICCDLHKNNYVVGNLRKQIKSHF